MRLSIAIIMVFAAMWLASIFLAAPPVARTIDPVIGMSVPMEGTSAWRFTEGGSITRFGAHGLNQTIVIADRRVYLYGDSYIEGLQVADEAKPDAVLARKLGDGYSVYGVGRSGTGLPSFIVHAREYERAFGEPLCHVFFVASVLDDVLNDHGDEYVWKDEMLEKRSPRASPVKMKLVQIVNRFHLNFVLTGCKDITELTKRHWKFLPSFGKSTRKPAPAKPDGLPEKVEFLVGRLSEYVKAPCLIVYCPSVPRICKGEILYDNVEADAASSLRESAERHGIGWLDVTPALLTVFERTYKLPRGFSNLGGPGNGHLNEAGIEAVFGYVAEQLKERYGL